MAIRSLRYNEDEILRKRCKEVSEVTESIRTLLDDMLETLHATPNGAAIAAPQIGILKRLVVIDMGHGIFKLVNPEIIHSSGKQECVEGCLSFPNRYGKTIRPQKVTIKYLDENGMPQTLTGENIMAKCLCHEIDHLNGEVFVDKVMEWLHN